MTMRRASLRCTPTPQRALRGRQMAPKADRDGGGSRTRMSRRMFRQKRGWAPCIHHPLIEVLLTVDELHGRAIQSNLVVITPGGLKNALSKTQAQPQIDVRRPLGVEAIHIMQNQVPIYAIGERGDAEVLEHPHACREWLHDPIQPV